MPQSISIPLERFELSSIESGVFIEIRGAFNVHFQHAFDSVQADVNELQLGDDDSLFGYSVDLCEMSVRVVTLIIETLF